MEQRRNKRLTSKDKQQDVQIMYEPEEAYAAEAFKKYLFLGNSNQASSADSKATLKMKTLIESSDYYLQNFKATRDSEFSDKPLDSLDITELRMQR